MAGTTRRCQVNIYQNATTETYTGDGVSGIYLWGAQLSDSASIDPYVPNYGAAPTAAAYYAPRLDYSPTTIQPLGMLVEEQRTNLALHSAAFDNAAWTPFSLNTTGTPPWVNVATAPDGTMTADKIIPSTSSTDVHAIASTATIAVANATAYTWSVYAKADGYDWISVVAYTNGTSYLTWFNVATGAVGTNTSGNTAHPPVAVGNGWYRLSVTRTTASTVAQFILYAANADNKPTFAGNGTSGVLVYGAQLEAGSFATSYIPTGASTVTRAADVASVSTQAFPYNQPEGSLVVNFTPTETIANGTRVTELSGGGSARVIDLHSSGTSWVIYNGTTSFTSGTPVLGAITKIAAAYKTGSYGMSVNGAAVATDASSLVNTATAIYIGGNSVPSSLVNGHIRQITYIPRRLTNAELQTRST